MKELLRELLARHVSPHSVYLTGVRDDGWFTDCYYILEKPNGFEVGYQERNVFTPEGTYATESEACAVVFEIFAHEMHWPVQQPSPNEPVGWSADLRSRVESRVDLRLEPTINELIDIWGQERRVLLQAPLALDAVRGRDDVLRPPKAGSPAESWHVLIEDVTVAASLDPDGGLELRLLGGGVNPVTVKDLVRQGVLRRVALVPEEDSP